MISLKLVPKGLINNIQALVQITAWRRQGDKPLSEPMMVSLLMHICVTQLQWVNSIKVAVLCQCLYIYIYYLNHCCITNAIQRFYSTQPHTFLEIIKFLIFPVLNGFLSNIFVCINTVATAIPHVCSNTKDPQLSATRPPCCGSGR